MVIFVQNAFNRCGCQVREIYVAFSPFVSIMSLGCVLLKDCWCTIPVFLLVRSFTVWPKLSV